MNVYEATFERNSLVSTTETFLAKDWTEATTKAAKLLESKKEGSKTLNQVELVSLKKLCELSEVA
jgi:translation elongation factor EF-4